MAQTEIPRGYEVGVDPSLPFTHPDPSFCDPAVVCEFSIGVEGREREEYGLDLEVAEGCVGQFFVFEECGEGLGLIYEIGES